MESLPDSLQIKYFFSSSVSVFWSICFLMSVLVVVVPDVELLDESFFLEQEMMVVLEKQEIRNY